MAHPLKRSATKDLARAAILQVLVEEKAPIGIRLDPPVDLGLRIHRGRLAVKARIG